jgi:hypothetical protein
MLVFIHIEHICSFSSANIDSRNLIFGHKLHIGTPFCGKCFLTRQIPTSCLPTLLVFIHIEHTFCICPFFSESSIVPDKNVYKSQQTGSRNRMGQKTLPTKWGTYMKLVTKYQISAINICWEKCYEKWDPSDSYFLFADLVGFYTHWTYMHIFRHLFLSNYWWQRSDIWSQASYRYPRMFPYLCTMILKRMRLTSLE